MERHGAATRFAALTRTANNDTGLSVLSEATSTPTRELLQPFERSLASYVRFDDGCPRQLAEAVRYSLMSGGKRLRPLLVLHAATMCDSTHEAAMPAACAVEMVHVYSLIHDDLPSMDNDDMRRGKPSCHIAFDEATAILAGDALLARAFEILATDIQPPECAARCCAELAVAAGASRLVGGQCDDLFPETTDNELRQLESVNWRKTAALLAVSLRLGAIVAQSSENELQEITSFGQKLGLAFQIVDDLLDLQGSESKLGKRVGQDVRQGKRTFPALIGEQPSRRRADQLAVEAIAHLRGFGEAASQLIALADYIVKRDH